MEPTRPGVARLQPPGDGTSSQHPPSPEITNWNHCRQEIETLYCEKGWKLDRIRMWMQQRYNITASTKQFKDKITSWGLGKNLRENDLAHLLLAFQRAERDLGRPQVKLRGRIMGRSQVNAYLKRKGKADQDILATIDANQPLPRHIEYLYPENPSLNIHPDGLHLNISPSTLTTPSWTATPSGAFSNQSTSQSTPASQHEPMGEHRPCMDLERPKELPKFNLQESLDRLNADNRQELSSSNSSSPDVLPESVNLLESFDMPENFEFPESFNSVMNQILSQDSSAGPEPSQPSQMSFYKMLSGTRLVSNHAELTRGLDRQFRLSMNAMKDVNGQQPCEDRAQRFLGCFFGGCVLRCQGASEGATDCFRHANILLKFMIEKYDPECLSALNGMLPILEAHGHKELAVEFLSNVLTFLQHTPNNPVAATAEFLIKVAARQLKSFAVEVKHLEDTHQHLKDRFGAQSPSALVGLYHIAWMCAREEEHRERALQILAELVPLASKIMGPSNFLTITSMVTMARVLSYVRTKEESIALVWQTIQMIDQKYARFHPYRLEVLHRLATLLIDTHRAKDAENILRGVIEQRRVVLGPNNSLTKRSMECLQEAIQATGRDVEVNRLESELLSPPRVSKVLEDTPSTAYLPLPSPI
ncbi:hypothetical protein EPUS_02274 [Endocarpon pusillum Z07020]|uniref:Clr5 domain-containing protein n=1 Tax=Endocarpon pusillum (strain Z07020 / HMAS-L-300199) TaxID=1263415 RepID=U1I0K4_ENDPU|nr:uncharacterized protein EPUS_02274 [Endocarpon pusillum Z07020]ERF76735.1 hypothetical protein EPUS_02274 [Endocarpon pusillum Z07020]